MTSPAPAVFSYFLRQSSRVGLRTTTPPPTKFRGETLRRAPPAPGEEGTRLGENNLPTDSGQGNDIIGLGFFFFFFLSPLFDSLKVHLISAGKKLTAAHHTGTHTARKTYGFLSLTPVSSRHRYILPRSPHTTKTHRRRQRLMHLVESLSITCKTPHHKSPLRARAFLPFCCKKEETTRKE